MIFSVQSIAQLGGAHMINGIVEGLGVAFFASAFLWTISCRNSGTRFAVWLSTLLAVAGLTLTALVPSGSSAIIAKIPHVVLPASWADDALIAWAVLALAGLLRIAIGLAQIWKLRRNCQDMPDSILDPQVRQVLEDFRSVRRVKLCVSESLRVPAAT